jgi:hypothetical protein
LTIWPGTVTPLLERIVTAIRSGFVQDRLAGSLTVALTGTPRASLAEPVTRSLRLWAHDAVVPAAHDTTSATLNEHNHVECRMRFPRLSVLHTNRGGGPS